MVQNQFDQEFLIQILKLMCPKNNETLHRKVKHSYEVQMAAFV